MYIETKKMLAKFCFVNVVIACLIIFLCGTLTASQKTAYNIYLREYSVMSMKNSSESLSMSLDGKSFSLNLPEKAETEKIRRFLKLTPLASAVYFAENLFNVFTVGSGVLDN